MQQTGSAERERVLLERTCRRRRSDFTRSLVRTTTDGLRDERRLREHGAAVQDRHLRRLLRRRLWNYTQLSVEARRRRVRCCLLGMAKILVIGGSGEPRRSSAVN